MRSLTLLTWNEVLAGVESVPRHTPAERRAMGAALVQAETATAANDPVAFGRSGRRFHQLLVQHASPATIRVMDRIGTTITRAGPTFANYRTYEFPDGHPGCMGNAQREHRAILEAVESGSAERTLDALLGHRDSMLTSFAWMSGAGKRARGEAGPGR